jgi:hypothetical protein
MTEFPTDKWLKISYKDIVINLVAIVRYKIMNLSLISVIEFV